ncbi:hypothetical protein D9615_009285 [Tricholomella constricta]|uniref:Uncharacterized protein n=1 Tax=Tricholomella constricta TaxID=117010 RepID=A0A8H5GWX2_9AGAR|nr:hypothetical protein D9615_009285 [Tricholomella constricta]
MAQASMFSTCLLERDGPGLRAHRTNERRDSQGLCDLRVHGTNEQRRIRLTTEREVIWRKTLFAIRIWGEFGQHSPVKSHLAFDIFHGYPRPPARTQSNPVRILLLSVYKLAAVTTDDAISIGGTAKSRI